MRRNNLILILLFLLSLFLFPGCEEEELDALIDDSPLTSSGDAGDPIDSGPSDYTALLDVNFWRGKLDPDEFAPGLLEGEWEDFAEAVIDGLGFMKWEQTKLLAEETGGRVRIESIMKFAGEDDDDSLCGLLRNWHAGSSKVPSYFQRDNLLGLIAIGNPTGVLDAKMGWLTKSDSFRHIIDSIPVPEAAFSIIMTWNTLKMTLKGYWYTAKDEYYPMIGDSYTVAIFENDEFNFEDSWYADTYIETSPIRFVIALELGEPGLVDILNQAAEDYVDTLDMVLFPSRRIHYPRYYGAPVEEYEEPEGLTLKTKQISGNEIYYLDFDGMMQLAWMEYGGALVISDLDTIKHIDAYFNPANPFEGVPEKFNEYIYVDIQKCFDNFYYPFEDEITDELDYWEEYAEGPAVDVAGQIVRKLRMSRLGVLELTEVFDGKEVSTTLELNKDAADLMLMGIHFLEIMLAEGAGAIDYSNGPFTGPDPARPPGLPEMQPVEPPAKIYPGDKGQGRS